MSKIITVTANSATDHFIEVRNLSLGQNTIAINNAEYACGKGVNVAKAIASLNAHVHTLGFVGSQSKAAFNAIKSTLLHTDFTFIDGKTRTNITLFDSQTNTETHIRTAGFTVTPADCQKLIEKLATNISAGDIVVLSGSLPKGASCDLYKTIIDLCHTKQTIVLLDSSGEALRQGLKAGPFLIKPNQTELEEIVGRTLHSEIEIADAGREIMNQGTQIIVVSRAAKGVVIITADATLAASVDIVSGKKVSNVGCGDAMVGGLAVATLQEYEPLESIKLGVACGTANLFSPEPGRFDKNIISGITRQVAIRSLS